MTGATTTTFDYVMPSLGADMDHGTVIEWNVSVGDEVRRGDVVARVETEKSDIDIEIWHGGTVREILVDPGRLVPVGTPLLVIETGEGSAVDATSAARPLPGSPDVTPPRARVAASPWARRLADEHAVDLSELSGSGPDGAIISTDVLAASRRRATAERTPAETAPTPEAVPTAPASRAERMRAMIAERMTRANAEIPHYFLQRDVDVTALLDHLGDRNAELALSDRILPAAAFVRAVALAAARYPEFNGHWRDGRFHHADAVNVAVAVSLRGGGLVTPQVQDADELDLSATMARLRELTTAARSGVVRSEAVHASASITVTNLGDRGADLVHGVISPPEAALVGFGRILERPWVVDGEVLARHVVTVTLAADHRATDGAAGSRFLAHIAQQLEHPEES